ncbi:MAG: replication restart helicase PriA, partial [Bacteroidota bacterium]
LPALRRQLPDVSLADLRKMESARIVEIRAETADARVTPREEQYVRFTAPFADPDAAADIVGSLRGEKQRRVLDVLLGALRRGQPEVRRSELTSTAEASSSTIQSLIGHGILEIVDREVFREPLDMEGTPSEPPLLTLHPAQTTALTKILESVESGTYRSFLLHGITGSGKTEVYIEALKRVLAQGKTGIVLVPEIALTPQTVRRFRSHFGSNIAVLHSRMSMGERFDSWRRLRSGEFDVVIGPRSAILAPLQNVGLIVVDEEHESSYKQFEPDPRYHARDVAVVRARMNDAVCILGSATPALETFVNARGGKYELLDMPDRVPRGGQPAGPMPTVHVVDLAKERRRHRLEGSLSAFLLDAIADRIERKEQVILLQNRRGYSPLLQCYSCGWSPECQDCAVTLTYHKTKHQLRCHYCGRAWRLPSTCPECHEPDLQQVGAGTQRVEEELAERLPSARIRRMDLDTTTKKGAHYEILKAFGNKQIDVLLGTQMIAKGLDFPDVTLVGVVDADTGLLLPDFRSEERTFQLLMQVAGRSGRADRPGEVILQTRNPDHPVLRFALTHDYGSFAAAALEERRLCSYPPFVRLAAIEFRGSAENEVERVAREFTDLLRRKSGGLDVLGPEAAFISRLKKQYRYHSIVKVPRRRDAQDVQQMVRDASAAFGSLPRSVRMSVDIDPVGLL